MKCQRACHDTLICVKNNVTLATNVRVKTYLTLAHFQDFCGSYTNAAYVQSVV